MNGCNHCGSIAIIKAGLVRGRQRYKCKFCEHYFIPNRNKRLSEEQQMDMVEWYLEGAGIRGLGRRLNISHTTVIRTLRNMAEKLRPPLPLTAENIEMDELFFFIGNKKNKKWLWLAVCRKTVRILAFQIGRRNVPTLKKLFHKISPIKCNRYFSDGWQSYYPVLPAGKHYDHPGGTNTVEGINTAVRHYLRRFNRKTISSSKSANMVEISIVLLMYRFDRRYRENLKETVSKNT